MFNWIKNLLSIGQDEPTTEAKPKKEPAKQVASSPKPNYKKPYQLARMNKNALDAYGKTIGIELDARKTKKNMIADLVAFQKKNKK